MYTHVYIHTYTSIQISDTDFILLIVIHLCTFGCIMLITLTTVIISIIMLPFFAPIIRSILDIPYVYIHTHTYIDTNRNNIHMYVCVFGIRKIKQHQNLGGNTKQYQHVAKVSTC